VANGRKLIKRGKCGQFMQSGATPDDSEFALTTVLAGKDPDT